MQVTGSIKYTLNDTAEFLGFPFIDETIAGNAERLNTRLGGYIYKIVGNNVAAINQSASAGGNSWVGSATQNIKSDEGYWLQPTGGNSSWGPSGTVTAELSGTLRDPSLRYHHHGGAMSIAYPFAENKSWADAVDEDQLTEQNFIKIIGHGVAQTVSPIGWVGSITNFTTGSAYWFITNTPGQKTIWKVPTGSGDLGRLTSSFHHCTDGEMHLNYGQKCQFVRNKNTGYAMISEYPYSQSAHTFGWAQSDNQAFHIFTASIGDNSSSLIAADGTPIGHYSSASSDNDTPSYADYIIGFFPTASATSPYPGCCGAVHWFSHTDAKVLTFEPNNPAGTNLTVPTMYYGTYTPELSSSYGYQPVNTALDCMVYDPTRGLTVSASIYNVSMSGGKPILTNVTTLSGSLNSIQHHVSGSATNAYAKGLKAIKLLA